MYKYPYGNSEELNLDWFLNQFQTFTADVQKKLASATVQSIIKYIAGEYDITKNYSENDYCVHDSSLYRATTSTTGEFNSNDWVIVKISDDITTIWGELTGLTTGLATAQTTASNAATAAANAQTTASNAATAAANAQTTASNAATAAANAQTDATTALTEITPITRGGTGVTTAAAATTALNCCVYSSYQVEGNSTVILDISKNTSPRSGLLYTTGNGTGWNKLYLLSFSTQRGWMRLEDVTPAIDNTSIYEITTITQDNKKFLQIINKSSFTLVLEMITSYMPINVEVS